MARDNKDGLLKLQTACLALSRLLAKEGKDFILQIKVGDQFSFCVESGMRNPAQKLTNNENRTKRKKSASGIERDRRRRIEFLRRKGIILPSAASDVDSGQMEKLNSVSHSAQEVGRTTGGINDSEDAQNKKIPGVREEGLSWTELDELWTTVKKLKASSIENALKAAENVKMIEENKAKKLLGIAELKSQIGENLDQVNVCLSEFR